MASTSFVALSDLHLGYDRSVLDRSSAMENLAMALGKACGGGTERLILNGDAWELCVPKDVGARADYLSPYTTAVSHAFFEILSDYLVVNEVVIVPGNHDYKLWRDVLYRCGALDFPCTGRGPFVLMAPGLGPRPAAGGCLASVFGPAIGLYPKVSVAYPAYFLGGKWPYLVFHHGHFLDDLVLGQEFDEKYHALAALGVKARPPIVLDDLETLRSLSLKTDDFLRVMWEPDSRARSAFWALLRRDDSRTHCSYVPAGEAFGTELGKNLEWFVSLLMADTYAPFPGGDKTYPSYLFVGHDHLGGQTDVPGPDGYPWKVINTGGWTVDGSGPPHGHAVIWEKGALEPKVLAIRV